MIRPIVPAQMDPVANPLLYKCINTTVANWVIASCLMAGVNLWAASGATVAHVTF